MFPQWGFTPMMRAALEGHTDIVDILAEQYGCSLTDVNEVSIVFGENEEGCYSMRHFP